MLDVSWINPLNTEHLYDPESETSILGIWIFDPTMDMGVSSLNQEYERNPVPVTVHFNKTSNPLYNSNFGNIIATLGIVVSKTIKDMLSTLIWRPPSEL